MHVDGVCAARNKTEHKRYAIAQEWGSASL